MTGFAVVTHPPGRDSGVVDGLIGASSRRGEPLEVAYHDGYLTLLKTTDLPCIQKTSGEVIAVGDVLGDFQSHEEVLEARRRRSLDNLLERMLASDRQRNIAGGEYHLAVWRPKQLELQVSHDWAGVKPVYFTERSGHLVLTSALRFMVDLWKDLDIDEGSLRRFIVGRHPAPGRTYYKDVSRLQPGHQLHWDGQSIVVETNETALEFPTTEAEPQPIESFKTLFKDAVLQRSGHSSECAALLSGGLDSSSIAVVMAKGRSGPTLKTLSLVFDKTPQWSERPFIEAVAAMPGIAARLESVNDYLPFSALEQLQAEQGGLFLAPGLTLTHRIFDFAIRDDVRVLIDGHGGDEVVSHGYSYYQDLAAQGAWGKLWRELQLRPRFGPENTPLIFLLLALNFGAFSSLGLLLTRLHRRVRRALKRQTVLEFTFPLLAAGHRQKLWNETRLDASPFQPPRRASREKLEHYTTLIDANQSAAFEILDASSSARSVTVRFPFWERKFVEFCLTVRAEDKVRDGYTRWILREAMDGLPSKVRWRRGKLDFSPHLAIGLQQQIDEVERHLQPGMPLATFVDLGQAWRLVHDLKRNGAQTSGYTLQALWRLGALGLWFERRGSPMRSSPFAQCAD